MRAGWSGVNARGQQIPDGTFCYVTEVADDLPPIYTYGKTVDEVLEKLALNNANAQIALARKTAPEAPAPTARERMTPEERFAALSTMQTDPANAGKALVSLLEDETGRDFATEALHAFAKRAMAWEDANPDFYPHPGNKRMLMDQAKLHTDGDIKSIDATTLTQAFNELSQSGMLFEAPAGSQEPAAPGHDGGDPNPKPSNLRTFPEEIPVQRERERGMRFATSVRSNRLRAPQSLPSTPTVKYTEEEILAMPLKKQRELIESDDQDFAAACEFHFGAQAAKA